MMATRITDSMGSRAIGPHMPLDVALAVIPSLPRPILARLVTRAIERLDELDGDPEVEDDDPREDDDHNEDDDPKERDDELGHVAIYGTDQRSLSWRLGPGFPIDTCRID